MRILVANDLYGPSSAAGIAASQARALVGRGHEVHFLGTVQRREEARTFDEPLGMRVHLAYVPGYPLRFRSWVSLANPPALRALRRVLDAVRPDVVHFHNVHIFLSYRALRVARRHLHRGIPVVLTVHDVMPFCFQKMFCFVGPHLDPAGPPISFKAPMPRCIPCARLRYNPFRNPWIRWHLRRHVSRIVAVSDEMRRGLQDNGIDNVETIANGIARPALPAGGDAAAGQRFRAEHGLGDRKVVLYGGRLDHRKGAEHLIRAMAEVRRRVPSAALLVVGSGGGGYEHRMVELAEELGLKDAIVLAGWLDQAGMAAAYEAADVVCTPSLIFESFGLINAEGMARGKPAVTAFFGGPKDVVEHGVSGFHVNPLHVDRLADALATLLEDDALRRRMGDAARARIRERFDLEAQAAAVEALYVRLAAPRTARTPA
jgi:glycosyltransferase involved in cell wall biosynthesis